ncbi:MAG: DUF2336 domain-containing protein [Phenylobacterium sp.]
MGLAENADQLLGMAKSREPGDRERLLMAVIDLCESADRAQVKDSRPVQDLLNSIFMALIVEAERDIRRRLAEKLATADWPPAALINVLALDDIEIARPIIAGSPVLQDEDLVRLLLEATLDHQIEVARRPQLGPPVIAAILARKEPAVLIALAGNAAVQLELQELTELVRFTRRVPGLGAPLSNRAEMTVDLARELYLWVGQSLRQSLAEGFRLDIEALDGAIAESVREAHGAAPLEGRLPSTEISEEERQEMEMRLVGKLKLAGQLRPGYLLRALREQKLSLFGSALAVLGGFEPAHVRRAIDADTAECLAMACAAVGIDRTVFASVLTMIRQLNQGRPGAPGDGLPESFGGYGSSGAAAAFRRSMEAICRPA